MIETPFVDMVSALGWTIEMAIECHDIDVTAFGDTSKRYLAESVFNVVVTHQTDRYSTIRVKGGSLASVKATIMRELLR